MNLRKQSEISTGYQPMWTYEQLKAGLDEFHRQHNRYPTAKEFDNFEYLPSSRMVQKKFGGLLKLRKDLELSGQGDFRTGKHSTNRAKTINKRAHKLENMVYTYLKDHFGVEFVHREHQFVDDGRSRTDFFVYDKNGNFSVDVFFASDRHSLIGCLNTKLRKYNTSINIDYPVIFLQMNEEIDRNTLKHIVENKKNQLSSNQNLMDWVEFEQFCTKRTPHSLNNDSAE